ncbi:MAG: ABC transporter substrate-binding protein [Alphaproteobacteria bacterium]
MTRITRRDTIKLGAGALAGTTLLGAGSLRAAIPAADVTPPDLPIEDGASLRVLRPSKFVDGDEQLFLENSEAFTAKTGVPVRIDIESWEDLRPRTAVSANVGEGPDVVYAWSDDPHKFVDSLLDLTDVAEYLGAKYGGWYPLAERYGTSGGRWIGMPLGASGGRICYRRSMLQAAGYDEPPSDVQGFLEMSAKLNELGTPGGLALGNAVGDANAWCNWVVWAFGGALVDENDQVIINSPETIAALEYAKQLYDTFIPGTLSWLDPANNKAFIDGQISWTQNGISIYYALKTSEDPALQELAEDTFHARMPIGPVGHSTERALIVNGMAFNYTPYPNAAKAYMTFMMESEQYDPYLNACIGYWGHPLAAYEASDVWTVDPKHEPFRDVIATSLWDGYQGSIGEASAAVLSDFVIVNMVASVCAGQETPEDAAAEAERRTLRYYRT